MKRIVLGILVGTAMWSSAEAKGGKGAIPIPPAYDYSREKVKGYKKDYCEDSVGNHIMCDSRPNDESGRFSATYR